MKKILTALLMITCVIGLTACGSESTMSSLQEKKIANAEGLSTAIIDVMEILLADSEFMTEYYPELNNEELGAMYASAFSGYKNGAISVEGKAIKGAITSFSDGIEEIGDFTIGNESASEVDGDKIIVTVPVTGERGSGSIELIFSNDLYMELESCTMNLNKSMGELMGKAALNTALGMGTVFSVLILICFIIYCFGFIPKLQEKFKKKSVEPVKEEVKAAPVIIEEENLEDDTELVAVIAAAIAAYEGTSTEGFQVRSIKRANTKKWQKA